MIFVNDHSKMTGHRIKIFWIRNTDLGAQYTPLAVKFLLFLILYAKLQLDDINPPPVLPKFAVNDSLRNISSLQCQYMTPVNRRWCMHRRGLPNRYLSGRSSGAAA